MEIHSSVTSKIILQSIELPCHKSIFICIAPLGSLHLHLYCALSFNPHLHCTFWIPTLTYPSFRTFRTFLVALRLLSSLFLVPTLSFPWEGLPQKASAPYHNYNHKFFFLKRWAGCGDSDTYRYRRSDLSLSQISLQHQPVWALTLKSAALWISTCSWWHSSSPGAWTWGVPSLTCPPPCTRLRPVRPV